MLASLNVGLIKHVQVQLAVTGTDFKHLEIKTEPFTR